MTQLLHLDRARRLMDEARLDALVATTPVNVRYLSGVHSWLDPLMRERMVVAGGGEQLAIAACVVLPREGEPALVLHGGLAANALASWIEDVRLYGAPRHDDDAGRPQRLDPRRRALLERIRGARPTALEALLDVLAARGLTDARIGVEQPMKEALEQALPHAWLGDCSALLGLLRMVKSDAELQRLERAAAIGEAAAAEAFATMRPGAALAGAAQTFRAAVAAQGAAFDHFALGPGGLAIWTLGDDRLAPGDCLFADFGCVYDGYFSDSAATIALGQPEPAVQARYEALRDAVAAGIAAVAPGVRASAVQRAMAAALAETPVVCDPPTGHGLGLEIRDWPLLLPATGARIADDCVDVDADLPLEAGMAINLEISAFMPGVASVEVERTIVVTFDGPRELVPQPREQIVRP
ncbi:M24 family metallopeptidase [Conexibacter sp. JD483]|uniref:M24 family metallopeptidase n=1 Tax=unclassified Conexibacter TaxID=2627773 RepID=UPI00272406F6|nr:MULTISPECIES: M24 family metallopeptidase [unclassified Conexibacter]MDO8189448.1 M24 family metallopeptidase [Conexibacter sp. CPCC 205706]MDO8202037.1 M24 family metallopeptidase [Conexibacter sp. CPCC 205762]MDR9372607.1 M24 family metallopeptidase [Conexibacter sp. JD483]